MSRWYVCFICDIQLMLFEHVSVKKHLQKCLILKIINQSTEVMRWILNTQINFDPFMFHHMHTKPQNHFCNVWICWKESRMLLLWVFCAFFFSWRVCGNMHIEKCIIWFSSSPVSKTSPSVSHSIWVASQQLTASTVQSCNASLQTLNCGCLFFPWKTATAFRAKWFLAQCGNNSANAIICLKYAAINKKKEVSNVGCCTLTVEQATNSSLCK